MADPRIKICCIQNVEEAQQAVEAGAACLGLVSEMPSGPGVISEEDIVAITESIPPGIATFLLTSKQDAADIIEQQKRCRTNTLQLVDRLQRGSYADLRAALPGIAIVQVIHVTGPETIKEALALAQEVDGILLDSGNPTLKVKELGGTGRVHDWAISRKIVESVPVPVYLAGGLNSDNVNKAVRQVRPFGVDVCSGVRTAGRLDERKLRAFVAAASRLYSAADDV